MKAEFLENTALLNTMKPGEVASSLDREQLFVCAHAVIPGQQDPDNANITATAIVIIDLKKLNDQYLDHKLDTVPIVSLQKGDKFLITI